ncbi:MAG: thioredoxin family protein [Candidatus Kapaibacterium sp.]
MLAKYLRNTLIYIALIASITACASAPSGNYSTHTGPYGKTMVVGQLSWKDWKKAANWDEYSAPEYSPNPLAAEKIQEYTDGLDVHYYIFGASWCPDSEEEMPRLYKLLNFAEIDSDRILLFGLDREKSEPSRTAQMYAITRVPTLVIVRDGVEMGRIIEHPSRSWETDILSILFQ